MAANASNLAKKEENYSRPEIGIFSCAYMKEFLYASARKGHVFAIVPR